MIWMLDEQNGWHNSTQEQKKYLMGKRYALAKKTQAEAGAKGGSSGGHFVHRLSKTGEQIAAEILPCLHQIQLLYSYLRVRPQRKDIHPRGFSHGNQVNIFFLYTADQGHG